MNDLFSLRGKTAIVTGSTRGIGLMIARGLVEEGVTVYICGRGEEQCNAVAEQLNKEAMHGGKAIPLAGDLSTELGVMGLANTIKQRENKLDILINNASIHKITALQQATFTDFTELMQTNVASLFILTQQLLPLLKQSASIEDPARIINMGSSIAVENNHWDSYVYAASKAAIHQITKDLANELSSQGITVNALAPSSFPSQMVEQYLSDNYTLEDIAQGLPLRRVGRPSDMKGIVLFLCSKAGSFITGNIISNDGGISIK